MTVKEWFKTQFTLDAIKASLPVWKKVFTSGWNLIMFLGLALMGFEMWKLSADAGGATTFLSTWLVIHRYIIAYKNRQIKNLIEKH
ncbi:hypothetical protein OU798_07285 [Prolixibacteraceae bacterium Z1-6]|uniref:Uncharacterized protein n=1 Tax=Draconibacterium aestuarii TaxID=2998507 RepID=A0A9X3F403_9BACT|nr:hypothetical protein [Prolixibacteraceae bacterium Z1-6]